MAQYKTFASKGSFSENQLKVPDESQKIVRAAERRIRGMNTAQAFLERNQELYLRAQQQAQKLEQATRESNFRMETENRKAFQDLLRRDAETELANNEARAANTQQLYKSISAFSKTAFDLYQSFDEMQKKNAKGLATQNILESGLDVSSLRGLFALDKNLETSALRQTEFFQDLIKQGYSEDQLRAAERIYKSSAPQQYLNNQYALQQGVMKFAPFYEAAMQEELPEGATVEQRRALSQQISSRFITQNYQGVRLDMLEASGVLKNIRSFTNQDLSSYGRQAAKEREIRLDDQFVTGVQASFGKNGVAGVVDILQTNPSKDKRQLITKWAKVSIQGTGPNSLSIEEAEDLLNSQLTIGNQTVAFRDQYPLEAGEISAAIRARRTRDMSDLNLREREQQAQADAELAQLLDSFAAKGDGRIDDEELERLNERAIQLNRKDSPVLEFAASNSVSAQTDREIEKVMMEKAENFNLKVSDVVGIKMGNNLRQRLLQIARQQESITKTPEVKSHIKAIEAAIAEEPRVREARGMTAASNYSVILMQEQYKRIYRQNLGRMEPEEALARTLQKIQTMQSTPGAINSQGVYSEIETRVKQQAQQANQSLKEYQDLLSVMSKPEFRTNPKLAVDSVGAANFYNSYNSMSKGGQPTAIVKTGAELMGTDPLTFMNYLAKGAKVEPIKLKDTTLQNIKANLPKITQRLYDTYRVPERISRANLQAFGQMASAPVRGAFQGGTTGPYDELLGLIRSGEGTYTSANRGTAGDTPGGIPGLDSMTVSDWKGLQRKGWFALGAYQFIPETFNGAVKRLGLSDSQVMDQETQDLLAVELISGGTKRPQLAAYLNGQSNNIDAALTDLANEWAAVATARGRSAYAGVGGNAASIGYDAAKQALIKLRQRLTK